MRKRLSKSRSKKPRIRIDRVLSSKSGRPIKTKLGEQVQQVLTNWEVLDQNFIIGVNDNVYALKLFDLSFDEVWRLEPLLERDQVVLIGVYGIEDDLDRKKLLGYIFLFVGEPHVYDYTFYLVLSYSDKDNIGTKKPTLIYCDKSLYFFKVGIGEIDYLFGYRDRQKEHDIVGMSSGAMHTEMADTWRDGM